MLETVVSEKQLSTRVSPLTQTLFTRIPNTMLEPNSTRFSMTYTETEAPVYVPIERSLMKELGVDRSRLHKIAIKQFYNRRKSTTLEMLL